MIDETFVPVSGYVNLFEISNFGRFKYLAVSKTNSIGVAQLYKERIVIGKDNGRGYLYVAVFHNKKEIHFYIHRLVAQHFVENKYNKPEVNHKDGDKKNNRYYNLEWCTRSENNFHAIRVLGAKRNTSGLKKNWKDSVCQTPVILYDLNGKKVKRFKSQKDCASFLNVCIGTVNGCLRGRLLSAGKHIVKYDRRYKINKKS